jgi:hypothetical protein
MRFIETSIVNYGDDFRMEFEKKWPFKILDTCVLDDFEPVHLKPRV